MLLGQTVRNHALGVGMKCASSCAVRRALAGRLPALKPTFMTVFLTKICPQALVVAMLLAVPLAATAQGSIAVVMQTTGPPVVISKDGGGL